ncbi:MAG: chorismate synthase, partial [Paludibacteraceae bacterium]|nr:chorismate synthase [Paludibacteraceae bacterium]
MNTLGEKYRFTSFGESHGPAIGGVIDGCPAGVRLDIGRIESDLLRRKGAGAAGVSSRAAAEEDKVEWLSGLFEGVTLGTPIAFIIRNTAARPEDYEALKDVFRPGHADFTYQAKYGIRDYRGGGRASARETAARVVAGAVAKQLLAEQGISVRAELVQVGEATEQQSMTEEIRKAKAENDSIGGIVRCTISGVPAGWGEPIFDKVQARLAYAMMSINACKGFEYGVGFDSVNHRGSE